MDRLAGRRVAGSGIAVDQRSRRGEELPFSDATFDCVVSTWTLCSIPEVGRALGEIYRVLKSGGRFLFLEHGLSDRPGVQRWQRRLNPIQRIVGDGCRLDLDVEAVVRSQPFQDVAVERFELERLPRTHGSMYRGIATR
jgi:SAM-dependent methyltransferase